METKITKEGETRRIVEVEVPEAELRPHFEKVYLAYQKNVKLKGFRKGKAPLGLIKKLFDKEIQSEAIDEVVQSVFREVSAREKLRPVAPAKVGEIHYHPEGSLHFVAAVEIVPEIEIKSYRGLPVEREIYEVGDEDVAAALEDVREQMAVMQPVEDAAQENHFVLADFQEVDVTGVPVIGKKYENRFFPLNQDGDDFNRQISQQLLGVKPGDTRRVEIQPLRKDASKSDKPELYNVSVKEIKSKQLPDLDDELAKDVGKLETLDQLKTDIKERIIKQSQLSNRRKMYDHLIDELLKQNPFDLPEAMINNYLDAVVETAKKENPNQVDEQAIRNQYRSTAIWNLKWEMAKDKIAEIENLTVTAEDKKAYLSRIAVERNVDEKKLLNSVKGERNQKRLEDDILESKILEILEQNANIRERKVTRKDLERAKELSLAT
ncbi:MAG TPA: trigger factor [bacterium]